MPPSAAGIFSVFYAFFCLAYRVLKPHSRPFLFRLHFWNSSLMGLSVIATWILFNTDMNRGFHFVYRVGIHIDFESQFSSKYGMDRYVHVETHLRSWSFHKIVRNKKKFVQFYNLNVKFTKLEKVGTRYGTNKVVRKGTKLEIRKKIPCWHESQY